MPSDDVPEAVLLGFAAIGALTVLAGCVLVMRKARWSVPALVSVGALVAAPRWVQYGVGGAALAGVAGWGAYRALAYAGSSRGRAMFVIASLIGICLVLGVSRA